jgi:hypothetical protein
MATLSQSTLSGVNNIPDFIPQGTRMLFCQSNPPSGWTRVVGDYDDRSLRVVTGAGGGLGGSMSFTTAFSDRLVPLPLHGHGVSDPGHKHSLIEVRGTSGASNSPGGQGNPIAGNNVDMTTNTTGISINLAGTPDAKMDFRVRYVDVIICEKL